MKKIFSVLLRMIVTLVTLWTIKIVRLIIGRTAGRLCSWSYRQNTKQSVRSGVYLRHKNILRWNLATHEERLNFRIEDAGEFELDAALGCLMNAGIERVSDLLSLTKEEILQVEYLASGPDRLEGVFTFLEKYHLHLKG